MQRCRSGSQGAARPEPIQVAVPSGAAQAPRPVQVQRFGGEGVGSVPVVGMGHDGGMSTTGQGAPASRTA
jgi:hypothetical protein